MKEKTGAFRVLCAEYVTAESGTGVVHQAPYFGEVRTFISIIMILSVCENIFRGNFVFASQLICE